MAGGDSWTIKWGSLLVSIYSPPEFPRIGPEGELYLDGLGLESVIEEVGTPLFVVSERVLRGNMEAFRKEFEDAIDQTVSVCYSLKTNPFPPVLQAIRETTHCADVTTGWELERALECGFSAGNLVFNGPGKDSGSLSRSLKLGLGLLNLDSLEEFQRLERTFTNMEVENRPALGIRVDPSSETDSKFGVGRDEAYRLAQEISQSAWELTALQTHIGTNIRDPEEYSDALDVLASTKEIIEGGCEVSVEKVDLGGGFPRLSGERGEYSIRDYAEEISDGIENTVLDNCGIILEPGRVIVGDAVCAAGQVIHKKRKSGTSWLFTDLGTHNLPPLLNADYKLYLDRAREVPGGEDFRIAGPLCTETDVLGDISVDGVPNVGDLVVAGNCGAYAMSFGSRFGFDYPDVLVVGEDGGAVLWSRSTEDSYTEIETLQK